MNFDSKQVIAAVLRALQHCNVEISKVVLHKSLYFLHTQGILTGLRFEPYTYGPYSFDLASTLSSMDFWGQIKERKSGIDIIDLNDIPPLDDDSQRNIESLLRDFFASVGGDDFATMELAGTILYCAESMELREQALSPQSIAKEFKAWKGPKYDDARIAQMIEKLQPFLPSPRNAAQRTC